METVPTNADVAAIFEEIAEMLEAQGENPFKIKAYRNAVRTLHDLPEPVSDVAARGELRGLPGFGEAIASKTQEILATGVCDLYVRLKAEQAEDDVPPTAAPPAEEDIPDPW
jgi:DNA polymerase (family 10)